MTCGELGWGHANGCLEVMKKAVSRWSRKVQKKKSKASLEKVVSSSCSSSLESLVEDEEFESECMANLKWKVENRYDTVFSSFNIFSKNCPRCFTLIQRDDGCNKVDCAMCGHKFCWICQGDWSEKCGFYRCRVEPVTPVSPEPPESTKNDDKTTRDSRRGSVLDDKPELGVPDVIVIQTRISRQQSVA